MRNRNYNRIGICGSHRVGKSTLASAISDATDLMLIDANTRKVIGNLDTSKSMNIDVRMGLQDKIISHLVTTYSSYSQGLQSFVVDRTPLDVIAYAVADFQSDTTTLLDGELSKLIEWCITVTNTYFTKIVLVQPGIPLVESHGKISAGLNPDYIEHLNFLLMGIVADSRLDCDVIVIDRKVLDIRGRVNQAFLK